MESMDLESLENQQVLYPEPLVLPELGEGESYHVFVSYCSSDQNWAQDLIQQLEGRGLMVCDHERDFTPGMFQMESMSECIAQSQKVLLVVSQDFVNNRMCLHEANMSLFRDCMDRKPIIPVLLQKDLTIPAPLAHLTYLELSHPDFSGQLLRVLCTPNHQLSSSSLVLPRGDQAPSVYNGKVFPPLLSLHKVHAGNCGVWSTEVPQPLRRIIQNHQLYKQAIEIINTVQRKKTSSKCHIIGGVVMFSAMILWMVVSFSLSSLFFSNFLWMFVINIAIFIGITLVFVIVTCCISKGPKRILTELQKALGEANALLYQENILVGSWDKSKLCLVFVLLDDCRRELAQWFEDEYIFDKVLREYASDYAVSLSKMFFPFEVNDPGHLEESVCFCQFVGHKLK